MKKIPSHYVFMLGSALLLIITGVYYFAIPRFEYFGSGYTIYRPGSALPESLPNQYHISNEYLLVRVINYLFVYLGIFILLYAIASRVRRLKIGKRYAWIHFILVAIGFILLVYINPFIIIPQGISSYLSDVYISGGLLNAQMPEALKYLLWHASLVTPSSIIGIVTCFVGILVFLIAIFRGWKTGVEVVD